MNILFVAAHPDDIEILCAGTLIKYANQGHQVTMAVFTTGNMGDIHIKPTELAAIREKETRAAAAIIGAKLIWAGVDDEHVFPNEAQRRIMIDILREADPDVIFTHSPNDYHPDHRYVSQLVFDSYFQKGLPFIPDQSLPACRFGQAQLYYMDNLGGIGFLPTEYVDISNEFE
ncbi:MAG: PIG-L family deacetylase, partial [Chitinophagaceae bacterium]